MEDFGVLLSGKAEADGLPEVQSEPADPVEILPEMGTGGGAQATDREIDPETETVKPEKGPKILSRKSAKNHSKPHIGLGSELKRLTVTFFDRESGGLRRWGVDCVFFSSKRRREASGRFGHDCEAKSHVLEFETKKGKDARFYFPMDTREEEVKEAISNWFEGLHVCDSEARVNLMGSPSSYRVDIQEE